MKKAFVGLLAVIGGIAILLFFLIVGLLLFSWLGGESVPRKTVLEINFEQDFVEDIPNDSVASLLYDEKTAIRDIVEALDRAGNDDRVVGLIAKLGNNSLGMAQVQEVRDAVAAFRAKKKFAVAYSETYGEVGPGNGAYYLATAFDEIWLQPSGDVGLTGFMIETQFLRGAFDKFGVKPRMDHRYEYKNAMNSYTETKFTDPHREALTKIINSWQGQVVKAIAESRQLTEAAVRASMDKGPFLGQEAIEAKLVDKLGYRDEVYAEVKKKAGGNAEFLFLDKYLKRAGRPNDSGKKIALIYGVGGVQRGASGYDPIFGDVSMGSDTVAAALRAAIDDDSVKAILFRVDSPGGSYVASDTIWREVMRAKEKKKPVIVSMGDLAGSGGYFVAMAADKIVAQPGTITGSIGVLGGKFVTKELYAKFGVTHDEVHAGANATMWSDKQDYTDAEWKRFQAWLDRVYDDFTTKVAEGRKLPKERVKEIAKGRIWSGEDAKAIGLVDELGGFPIALKLTKQAAGIAENEKVNLQIFPQKQTFWESFFGEKKNRSEAQASAETLKRTIQTLQPAARQARRISGGIRRGLLSMPEFEAK